MSRTTARPSPTTLPGAPRRALITPWALLLARIAGRRDGRRPAEPGADGHFDHTRRLDASVHLVEARIGRALAMAVEEIDAQVGVKQATVATLQRRMGPPVLASAPSPHGGASTASAVRERRATLHRQAQDEQLGVQVAEHERTVEHLLVTRAAVHRVARAVLGTHVARRDALCAAYLRAWRRRVGKQTGQPGPAAADHVPAHGPRESWVGGELPRADATSQE